MAEDQIPTVVDDTINDGLGDAAPTRRRTRAKKQPSYKVVGDSKIPVSKAHGKVWKSRVALANKHTENVREAWEEAIRYYENDQLPHRHGQENSTGNRLGNRKLNDNITETENVVFANVTTMTPALYARNPEAEFTANVDERRDLATLLERLVNVIGGRKAAPGINLKPKAKRCVVTALLTNRAWIKIGWTPRAESSEQALQDLEVLAKQLAKAKDTKDVIRIEGEIQALEETVDLLQPSGPYCKVKTPFQILVDPHAKEIDLSDARWVMEEEMIPTEFILARYATRTSNHQEYKSIYAPTHVMKASLQGDAGHENEENYSIFANSEEDTAKSFGFDDEVSFNKAKLTKVFFVWDKTTRRVLLYNSNDWTWPIWVWDDPLQLDTFFPFFPLTFFESPSGPVTKGEVTYYLDQQDGINEITDEYRRARKWARRNLVYNVNAMSKEEATSLVEGDDGTLKGLNVPLDADMTKLISGLPAPGLQFDKLFDKEGYYRAIDRISSVNTVMRGEQFKTNTNQKAVDANVGASNMRVDEKSDAIEDWIGNIYWGIAQLCLMNMDPETVTMLIGEAAQGWTNMGPEEISQISSKVMGGSTQKPTSQAKKEEALEFGQVLGQFVNAAPGPVLKIMLQVMEKAFDEVTMREEDWQELAEAIQQQAQAGAGGQGGPAGPTGPAEGQPGGANDISTASPEQLKQLLEQLPPEIKQQVQSAIQSGVSPKEALAAALQQMQAQQESQGQPVQ